jgi:hypothetical protein
VGPVERRESGVNEKRQDGDGERDLGQSRSWQIQLTKMIGQHKDRGAVSLVHACVKTFRDDTIR